MSLSDRKSEIIRRITHLQDEGTIGELESLLGVPPHVDSVRSLQERHPQLFRPIES